MRYLTVTELAEKIGSANIATVEQQGRYVCIQMSGGLIDTQCNSCKSGSHTGASVRPRIKISNY